MSSLARATAIMSFGTVLSRLTGVLRLTAIAAAIGAAETRLADSYNLANTAPNIIYELVLGGVLTSVFVPVFVELLQKEGREKASEVVAAIINVSVVVLTAIATIGILAAPLIAKFYAIRLEGPTSELQQQALTFLLRLFLPQIVFYGLAAMTAGLLNANKRFGPPMYTPVLNNLSVIAVFATFAYAYSEVTLAEVTTTQLLIIGLGTTAGVAINAFAQQPFLRGVYRHRLSFKIRHPSVRKLARLSVFVVGYVIVNQIGYLIVQWLANAQQGGYTSYVFAFTFFMLPHGLFAVSVLTALLPGMSEFAVNERWDDYRRRLSVGMRATILLILPAAVGYFVLAEPIVRLLLEHGVFSARSTELVSGVLRLFVLGLVPFSLFQLLLRAFYAIHDTKTPFLVNCTAIGLNIAVNIPLFVVMKVQGLALGHALSYVFGVTLLWRALAKRVGGLDGRHFAASAVRIAGAAGGMGVLVWLAHLASTRLIADASLAGQAAVLLIPVSVGVVAYVGFAYLFKVQELAFVRSVFGARVEPGG